VTLLRLRPHLSFWAIMLATMFRLAHSCVNCDLNFVIRITASRRVGHILFSSMHPGSQDTRNLILLHGGIDDGKAQNTELLIKEHFPFTWICFPSKECRSYYC
jgi:hypothetical protein